LLAVFCGSLISPLLGDWVAAFSSLMNGNGWPLDVGSIIGKIFHVGYTDTNWFTPDGNPTQVFIVDATRIVLLLTFLIIAWMIKIAWKKHTTHSL